MRRRSQLKNPFVGLRPFKSEDSLYYFGRREQSKALLRQLHQTRFLAVVGSSGCGKSSLVSAGLIPNLEAGFLVQDRDLWHIATMKPGDAPLQNLARALLTVLGESTKTEALETYTETIRRRGAQAVLEKTQATIDTRDANLLLLVDQFEELFRFQRESDGGQEEAADFVSILMRLAEQAEAPIFICLTMRSDFLGDCDAFQGLPEAMNRSQYLVPRLTRQQRREAISSPIYLAGAKIAPRLLDRLLNENVGTRDDLPILQHALMRTWTQWTRDDHGPIDMAHYDKIHTVQNALNSHAEEALNELNEGDRIIAKRLFQTLTEIDAGNRRVRRPSRLSEIAANSDTTPQKMLEVIRKFREKGRSFLVLSSENPEDDPLVDISHESLIRQWHRMYSWVEQEAGSAETYHRLEQTARLWQRGKAALWGTPDLEIALNWVKQEKPTEKWAERYGESFELAMGFLRTCEKKRNEDLKKKDEEHRRKLEKAQELAEARQQRIVEQVRAAKRMRTAVISVASVLIITIAIGVIALTQYTLAKRALKMSKTRELLYYSNLILEEDPTLSFRLAEAALKNEKAAMKKEPAVLIQRALSPPLDYPLNNNLVGHQGLIYSSSFSKDGKKIVTASDDHTARIWNGTTGQQLHILRHQDPVVHAEFSMDGKIIVTASKDRTVRIWDAENSKILKSFKHKSPINYAAFSPDSKKVVTVFGNNQTRQKISRLKSVSKLPVGSLLSSVKISPNTGDHTARIWKTETGEQLHVLKEHEAPVYYAAFSPDGQILVTTSGDHTARIWKTETGEQLHVLKEHKAPVYYAAFSPDGQILVTASADQTACTWDITSGKHQHVLKGHYGSVYQALFSPDGKNIITASNDETAGIWDTKTGEYQNVLRGHYGPVVHAEFSMDGKSILTTSKENTARIWNIESGEHLHVLKEHKAPVYYATFSPDDQILVTTSGDHTARIWKTETGEQLHVLKEHEAPEYYASFSPDGKNIVTASNDGTARIWNATTGQQLHILRHQDPVVHAEFSMDGKKIVTASKDHTARIWDSETGKQLHVLKEHEAPVYFAAYSPDNQIIVTTSGDHTARIWNIFRGELRMHVLRGHHGPVVHAAFSPDGRIIATASEDGTARIWNVRFRKLLQVLRGHRGSVNRSFFSPDGKNIVTASNDGSARIWDTKSGEQLHILKGHQDSVVYADFAPKGHDKIVTASIDGTARIWPSSYKEILKAINEDKIRGTIRQLTTRENRKFKVDY